MIEFLVDNIHVRFGGQLFRQMVGIPMGTNCAPLLDDLLLYSCENEFLDKLIKESKRKLARKFNLSYHYIHDLISFNNKRFKEFISDIYPKELTIFETMESTSVASYLDLLFIFKSLGSPSSIYWVRSYKFVEFRCEVPVQSPTSLQTTTSHLIFDRRLLRHNVPWYTYCL